MSIVVADLLKLPSLSMARVIAGNAGLNKVVSSISVLECMDAKLLSDELFKNDEFYGSEIVITSFVNAREDIDVQCNAARRLYEGGEVGLILFYVGIFMPRIDERLIQLCNELGFTLICMPENRMDCRYSEVIMDVVSAILRDQQKDTYFVGEMLERITALPDHQKSMDAVLRLLSDRLGASLFLANDSFQLLNYASWPRIGNIEFDRIRASYNENPGALPAEPEAIAVPGRVSIAAFEIHDTDNAAMRLIMVKEHADISKEAAGQAAEVVRLFTSIWGRGYGNVGVEELVRAIINDEPIKMRRLAEIFHIDIAAINHMVMIMSGKKRQVTLDETVRKRIQQVTDEILKKQYKISMFGNYQNHCLIFTGNANVKESSQMILQYLYEQIYQVHEDIVLVSCSGLENTADVRNSFLLCQEFIGQARSIYPNRQILTIHEVKFARKCQEILTQGEDAAANVLKPLKFPDLEAHQELYQTLETYLLDADMNIARTAELLFVHKNTIKYRVANLNKLFNCQIGKMPEAYELYQAVAVNRLLKNFEYCPNGQNNSKKFLPKA